MNNKITIVLAWLRGGIAGIYVQKKIDKLEDIEDTQDWEEFVKEIKTAFSDKSKAADAEWKIKTFQQGKKHIADFMIKFDALTMKAETDDMHVIFLLKKNIRANIIKTTIGYPPMAAPDTLKEWKMVITSVGQGYESTESWHNYKTGTRITFGGREVPMDIGKFQDNFDKDRKPKYFNYNIYGYLVKECKRPKKNKETRKCYKYDKVEYLAKDCRSR